MGYQTPRASFLLLCTNWNRRRGYIQSVTDRGVTNPTHETRRKSRPWSGQSLPSESCPETNDRYSKHVFDPPVALPCFSVSVLVYVRDYCGSGSGQDCKLENLGSFACIWNHGSTCKTDHDTAIVDEPVQFRQSISLCFNCHVQGISSQANSIFKSASKGRKHLLQDNTTLRICLPLTQCREKGNHILLHLFDSCMACEN